MRCTVNSATPVTLKELLKNGTDDEIREQIKHAIENKPAEHCFEKPGEITEAHQMAQIGG